MKSSNDEIFSKPMQCLLRLRGATREEKEKDLALGSFHSWFALVTKGNDIIMTEPGQGRQRCDLTPGQEAVDPFRFGGEVQSNESARF